MKFIGILIIVLAIFYFLIYPPVSQEKQCFDTSQKTLSDIGYFSSARGWTLEETCKKRSDELLILVDCIEKVKESTFATRYANSLVEGLLPLIRPSSKGIETLKNEHNTECEEFPTYTVE